MTFKDGTNTIGTSTLSGGVATFGTDTLSVTGASLTAVYGGDPKNAPSTSSVLAQTVNQASTLITLSSAPNPSYVGQTVTVTAAVTPVTATGTVTFRDGENTLGTATLNNGTAVISVATLTQGLHNLTAAYGGDANYLSSLSAGNGPSLNFTSAVSGTVLDSGGQGTGFTTRLPGTGSAVPANDPQLTVNAAAGTLTFLSTASDVNGQINLAAADFIGFPLSAAGVTLNEDFSVSATFRNVQYGEALDQFGIFVGTAGDNLFRGGALFSDGAAVSTTGTTGGVDQNVQMDAAHAPSPGDDVTFTLSRTGGTWAMTVQNLTTPEKSGTLPIVQPGYLNGVTGLVAGVFANNARNSSPITETVSSFALGGAGQIVNLQVTSTALTSSRTRPPSVRP